MALADAVGVDRSEVLDLLGTGRLASPVAAGKARKMDSGDDSPDFALDLAVKGTWAWPWTLRPAGRSTCWPRCGSAGSGSRTGAWAGWTSAPPATACDVGDWPQRVAQSYRLFTLERVTQQDVEQEQAYVSMLYAHLDELRERTSGRLAQTLRQTGGTPQARTERDVMVGMYTQRLAQLDAAEMGLCFGRIDSDDGDPRYIGRLGIRDEDADYKPLLLDWRAPAARPFYLATPVSPEGVRRRRHIKTVGREVTRLDDEVLDLAAAGQAGQTNGLNGEVALLAALNASRTGQMTDIVETIQVEQDWIIRSPNKGALVVQGGPGTGKTAVALHRAAYLLYTHREQLARRVVLVIGPSPTFLRYVGQVLPSLGETSVLLSTIADLYPGITARRDEPVRTAQLKGRLEMAEVIAAAVADREGPAAGGTEVTV